jgi:hypothetical protein
MTTISSNTTALASLLSLYANSSSSTSTDGGASNASTAGLTSDQMGSVVNMVEGTTPDTTSGLDAMLADSSSTDDGSDMSAVFDAIDAQMEANATSALNASSAGSDGTSTSTTSTATAEQQKAAALMQSVYQSQQSNLFTLLG